MMAQFDPTLCVTYANNNHKPRQCQLLIIGPLVYPQLFINIFYQYIWGAYELYTQFKGQRREVCMASYRELPFVVHYYIKFMIQRSHAIQVHTCVVVQSFTTLEWLIISSWYTGSFSKMCMRGIIITDIIISVIHEGMQCPMWSAYTVSYMPTWHDIASSGNLLQQLHSQVHTSISIQCGECYISCVSW